MAESRDSREVVAKTPSGRVVQCVHVELGASGLQFYLVNDDGEHMWLSRHAVAPLITAMQQMLVTTQAEALAEVAQYSNDDD